MGVGCGAHAGNLVTQDLIQGTKTVENPVPELKQTMSHAIKVATFFRFGKAKAELHGVVSCLLFCDELLHIHET